MISTRVKKRLLQWVAAAVLSILPYMRCSKTLRKKMSKHLDVPPYVIFQDPSLEAMATIYPITLEELQNIPGVGVGKAKRYGTEFCKLIKKHCEENEIERPEDLRVRTVANKSKIKVSIIQAIDRKVALMISLCRRVLSLLNCSMR
jgi:ribonuclease D